MADPYRSWNIAPPRRRDGLPRDALGRISDPGDSFLWIQCGEPSPTSAIVCNYKEFCEQFPGATVEHRRIVRERFDRNPSLQIRVYSVR